MYKFKLTSEQFKAVFTYLKSLPVARVENGLPIMQKLENEPAHIFEQNELVPILEFMSKEPYASVAHILNSIYPLEAINKAEVDNALTKESNKELTSVEKRHKILEREKEVINKLNDNSHMKPIIEKKKRGRKPKVKNVEA